MMGNMSDGAPTDHITATVARRSPPDWMARAALVISECQAGILDRTDSVVPPLAAEAERRQILSRIHTLATAFRSNGLPVVYCLIAHRPDFAGVRPDSLIGRLALRRGRMVMGSPDVAVPDAIAPQPGDFLSWRTSGVTAFHASDLDATLHAAKVDTVVLCGVSTNLAIPGLALGCTDRNYRVLLAEDATAAVTPAAHDAIRRHLLAGIVEELASDAIVAALTGAARDP
jgi:nicotinamidase-related amidase